MEVFPSQMVTTTLDNGPDRLCSEDLLTLRDENETTTQSKTNPKTNVRKILLKTHDV